jgi:hypothetical protein
VQAGQGGQRGGPGETQRPLVLGRRLPVGADRGGAVTRGRRQCKDGGGVARVLSMMNQPRRVDCR